MKKYNYYLLFSLFVLWGCRNNSAEKIQIFSTAEFIELVDTISIEINSEQLGKYYNFHISDDNYLIGYNKHLHRLDVFNLDQRAYSYSVQLEKRGPNGIPPVLYFIKIRDEYIIKSGQFFSRISKDGMIISKKPINELRIVKDGYGLRKRGSLLHDFHKTSEHTVGNCFLQPIYKYREDGSIDPLSYFMGSVNAIDWTSRIINVNYPEQYVELYPNIGFLGVGHMVRNGHLLIYNYPEANEVYVYDTLKNRLMIHDPFIDNRNEMIIEISENPNPFIAQLNGQMFLPRYLGIEYNSHSNTYYRVHKTKARDNHPLKTDFFLIKMDSNFNTLVQYNLGRLFNPKFQIHQGDLYFTSSSVDKDA